MIEKKENGLHYFEFPHFAEHPGVVHGLFTRKGGFSEGPYQGLNMGVGTGDLDHGVDRNKEAVLDHMNASRLVSPKQVHGTEVLCWDSGTGIDGNTKADAVITDEKGVLLLIKTADCQAVLLLDPVRGVVANIHSGWRGSVANIIGKTMDVMVDKYGSDPADVLAGVGPSLGPCCAEFVNYEGEIPQEYWMYKDNRHHFDFWSISRNQLEQTGVKPGNIHVSGLCTACHDNKDLFFSYRRDKLTGRLANVIGLKNET